MLTGISSRRQTLTAHVVYQSGEWKKAGMDGMTCDKHPSALSCARVLFPNLCVLYMCNHCATTLLLDYEGQYHVTYETVTV